MVLLFGSIKIILIPISSSNFFPAGQQNCFGQIFVDFVLETRHLAAMPLPPPPHPSHYVVCGSAVYLSSFCLHSPNLLVLSVQRYIFTIFLFFFFVFANFGIHLRCSLSLTLSLSRSDILGCVHLICFASCANV